MSMPSCKDAVATSTLISPSFSRCSASRRKLARERSMMRGDLVFAKAFAEMQRNTFGQPARVHEDQRRAMLVARVPRGGRRSRPTARWWRSGPISPRGTSMARSSSRRWPTSTTAGAGRSDAGQEVRDFFERLLRRGKSNPDREVSPLRASRRSSESSRCAPRLSPATAWISSTITVSTSRRLRRLFSAVSRM